MIDHFLIDIPERLEGERVVVRAYLPGDGPALREAVAESREDLRPWMPFADEHQTDADAEAFVRKSRARWFGRDDMGMGIFARDSGKFLGGTGLHRVDWRIRRFEIGYWIRSSETGKGYVTEAVQLLCSLAFDILNANRVHIRCAVINEKSAAVARRAGFHYEGVLRNDVLSPDGRPHDSHSFSLTPEDWARLGA